MSIKGSMEGWYGDEMECKGRCKPGTCEDCEELKASKVDDDYDQWQDYQSNGG